MEGREAELSQLVLRLGREAVSLKASGERRHAPRPRPRLTPGSQGTCPAPAPGCSSASGPSSGSTGCGRDSHWSRASSRPSRAGTPRPMGLPGAQGLTPVRSELDKEIMLSLKASTAAMKKAGVTVAVRDVEKVMDDLDDQLANVQVPAPHTSCSLCRPADPARRTSPASWPTPCRRRRTWTSRPSSTGSRREARTPTWPAPSRPRPSLQGPYRYRNPRQCQRPRWNLPYGRT